MIARQSGSSSAWSLVDPFHRRKIYVWNLGERLARNNSLGKYSPVCSGDARSAPLRLATQLLCDMSEDLFESPEGFPLLCEHSTQFTMRGEGRVPDPALSDYGRPDEELGHILGQFHEVALVLQLRTRRYVLQTKVVFDVLAGIKTAHKRVRS